MSRRKMFQTVESTPDQGINLTPLIDVVFVVLVMFILIAPMINIDRIELAQGEPSIQQNKMDQSITIQIRKDNTIWLNKREVSVKELERLLTQAKKNKPQTVPQIMPDKNATFQAYEHVRSASKKAGFELIDVNLSH